MRKSIRPEKLSALEEMRGNEYSFSDLVKTFHSKGLSYISAVCASLQLFAGISVERKPGLYGRFALDEGSVKSYVVLYQNSLQRMKE